MDTALSSLGEIQDAQQRLAAWASVLTKVNRIIADEPVTVTVDDGPSLSNMPGTPAYTDGRAIHYNGEMMYKVLTELEEVDAVLRIKGVNYHELAHVLFSPRADSEFFRRLYAKNTRSMPYQVVNCRQHARMILEDQRIETLFAAIFKPAVRYLESAVLEWVQSTNESAALLLYGRKYLPKEIRAQSVVAFKAKYGEDLWERSEAIIDKYVEIVLPGDTLKAVRLVMDMTQILMEMRQENPSQDLPETRCGDTAAPDKGHVDTETSRDAVAAMQQQAKEEAEEAGPPEASDSGEGEAGDDDDSQPEGEQSPSGAAAGQDEMETLRTMAQKAREGIREDQDLLDEVQEMKKSVQEQIRTSETGTFGVQSVTFQRNRAPVVEDLALVRRIASHLKRIKVEAEPSIQSRQTTGRLDMQRLLNRLPNDFEVFRSYDTGSEDEVTLEAVILVDISGSMSLRSEQASVVMWALKRAMDQVGVRVTVLAYDHGCYSVYEPSQKVPYNTIGVLPALGGTEPSTALKQAWGILRKSSCANTLLVTLTDGDWAGAWQVNENATMEATDLIDDMNKRGTTTALLGFDRAVEFHGSHGHTIAKDVGSVAEVPEFVLRLAERVMLSALRNHR